MSDLIMNAGDWNDGASFTGGVVPANDDTLLIPSTNTSNHTNVTAQAAKDVEELIIEEGHSVDIGGFGTELQINANRLTHRGSGTLFFDGGSTNLTNVIVVNSPQLAGNGAMQIVGGQTDPVRVYVYNGLVTFGGGLGTITAIQLTQGKIVAADNSSAWARFSMTGGIAEIQVPVTTCTVSGGTYTQKVGRAITTLVVGSGARVIYESLEQMTLAIVMPGAFLDLSPKGKGSGAKTVVTLVTMPGGRVEKNSLVSITNDEQEMEQAGFSKFGLSFGGGGSSL